MSIHNWQLPTSKKKTYKLGVSGKSFTVTNTVGGFVSSLQQGDLYVYYYTTLLLKVHFQHLCLYEPSFFFYNVL